jgi:acyl transferase domain-containing protein
VENTPWPVSGLRRASVNCFGFGGTNAHIILDDAAHYLAERGLVAHHNTTNFGGNMLDPSLPADKDLHSAGKTKLQVAGDQCHHSMIPVGDSRSHSFVMSAHEQSALLRLLQDQINYLAREEYDPESSAGEELLNNLAYTLGCRRSKHPWRVSVAARSVGELLKKLRGLEASAFTRTSHDKATNIVFVFGGQGAQWFSMGRELMEFDIFLSSIVAASTYLSSVLRSPFSLLEELLRPEFTSQINEPHVAQPATTVIQIALIDLLVRFYGVVPNSVVGHSSGEIAAAYAMGALTRESAWELAYYRGVCAREAAIEPVNADSSQTQARPLARMLAVGLSASGVQPYVDKVAEGNDSVLLVACINSPASVTLSGGAAAIEEVRQLLLNDGVFSRPLVVNVAYHSPHMGLYASKYRSLIRHIQPQESTGISMLRRHPDKDGKLVTAVDVDPEPSERGLLSGNVQDAPVMYSSLTGRAVTWDMLTPEYWVQNMTCPVRFLDAMNSMIQATPRGQQPDTILELGPHATLQSPITQIYTDHNSGHRLPTYLTMLRRNEDAALTALESVGKLWSSGYNVNMAWVVMRNIQTRRPKLLGDLPRYPWNHDTLYWHESHLSRANRFQVHGRYDLIGRPTADSIPFQPRWRGFLRVSENPWIMDHQVQKTTIYPASGFVAMAIEAVKQHTQETYAGIEVSQFQIERAMIVPLTEHGLEYAVNMTEQEKPTTSNRAEASTKTFEFFIYSKPLEGEWQRHGHGFATIHLLCNSMNDSKGNALGKERYAQNYLNAKNTCDETIIPRHLYESLDVIGLNYGPLFQNITSLQKADGRLVFTICIPDTKSSMPAKFEFPHTIHPATLDSIFQTAFGLATESMVPSYIGSIFVSPDASLHECGAELVGYVEAKRHRFGEATANFVVSGDARKQPTPEPEQPPLLIIKDMRFTPLPTNSNGDVSVFLPSHHKLCSELIWEDAPESAAVSLASKSESSTNQDQFTPQTPSGVFILLPKEPSGLLRRLQIEISKKLCCETLGIESIVANKEIPKHCISLLEASRDLHYVWNWSEEDYIAFRTLVAKTESILWVTQGSQMNSENPKASLFQAIARTIHSEEPKKRLFSFDVDHGGDTDVSIMADDIIALFLKVSCNSKRTNNDDTAFAQRNGKLLVQRLVPLSPLNLAIEQNEVLPAPIPQLRSRASTRPLKLTFHQPGRSHSICWDDDNQADQELLSDQVKIKILSSGLSMRDVSIAYGVNHDDLMGTDAFGTIEAVGSCVIDLVAGDRVIAIVQGSFRDYVLCNHNLVYKLDKDIADPSLVMLPTGFSVANYALVQQADLKKHHTVLVHSGSSVFGQAAIQIASQIGARVLTTVTTEEQRIFLRDAYRLPNESIIDDDDETLNQNIMHLTQNMNLVVIYDPNTSSRKSSKSCVADCNFHHS